MEDDSDGGTRPQRAAASQAQSRIQLILSALAGTQGGRTATRLVNLGDLRGLLRFVENEDDEEDEADEDEDDEDSSDHRGTQWFTPVTEPQEAGVQLLRSGDFGRVRHKLTSSQYGRSLARLVYDKYSKPCPTSYKEDYANSLIPNSNGTAVAHYRDNVYTGQFSRDSSFYYTCSQDFRLHIYDTNVPLLSQPSDSYADGLKTTMSVKRSIQAIPGRWTITDANLSPGNERMVYSSITSTVYMTSTVDDNPVQVPIPFDDPPSRRDYGYGYGYGENFGIWSCRFSADGNEIVAGGSGKIFVYDLLANRRTVKIEAHNDDVNSCCWADTQSGNVLVSASDDSYLKVWDRRSLGNSRKPSGVLIGHTEGITYVSAKGDGRYVISNGKDQAVRLWDLRKMRTSKDLSDIERKHQSYGVPNFDYRYPPYPRPRVNAHPMDCSVMTYRGHSVLRTLIRCHFSPGETTGFQYIYSGSSDGRIHIWSLDGRVLQVLDRSYTLPISFDPSEPEPERLRRGREALCVRDLSWHSQEPYLLSAAWNSHRGGTNVARHEWKGLSKMSGSLEDWTEKARLESEECAQRNAPRSQLQRPYADSDDSDMYSEES